MTVPFAFDNSYARLPVRFHARLDPTPVAAPRLLRLNEGLAVALGLDPVALASPEGLAILAGNRVPEGASPLAIAYAGHQFGHFVPQLGDGRALLLGEVIAPDGSRHDIQLKGSGRTPFSRGGDGRAALGPVLREYLVSEAMAALGVPTTRALAAVATGESVARETDLPGAILTRVAASHIRVGTFQYHAARGDTEAVRLLADHAIARHYPEAATAENPYRAFYEAVVARQADLVAHWLLVGFIHGVMNTDNTAISGETIDYGPCAFMDAYAPGTVFSSIDRGGRYAYGNQPAIAQWNLARLAETLLPLFGANQEGANQEGGHQEGGDQANGNQDRALALAKESLGTFAPRFHAAYFGGLRRKIGITAPREGDDDLVLDLLKIMADQGADFTLTFRRLSDAVANPPATSAGGESGLRALFSDPAALTPWLDRWWRRLVDEPGMPAGHRAAMRSVNPRYIPRNHRVEAALDAAIARDDLGPFEELLAVVSRPYEDQPDHARYEAPPEPGEKVLQTFCGT